LTSAKVYCQQKAIEIRNKGLDAFKLNDEQRLDALKALEILAGSSSLTAAAQEFVRVHPLKGGESVLRTAARYLRDMKKSGCRHISILEKRQKFRLFCRDHGRRVTAGLTEADISSWADTRGYTGTNRDNYIGAIKTLLNFFHGRKQAKRKASVKPAVTWKVFRVEYLFRIAEKELPAAVPWLALLWFCGLRPAEAERIEWDQINLDDAQVSISPDISKVADARTVDIAPNALRWLTLSRKRGGLVSGGKHVARRYREYLKRRAGIEKWTCDVSRHTFATAHYVCHQNAAKTLAQLGHFESAQTFIRHYKGLMGSKDATKYWAIVPVSGTKKARQVASVVVGRIFSAIK
jgi:integrase